MWKFCAFLVAVLSCLIVHTVTAREEVCGVNPTIWRNKNVTCPERAVCAVLTRENKTVSDGTTCEVVAIRNKCLCPGGTACPADDPHHRLYLQPTKEYYTCQPICKLPYCSVVTGPLNQGNPPGQLAQTVFYNADNFAGDTLIQMECRCYRHHVPYSPSVKTNKAVRLFNDTYDSQGNMVSSLYDCRLHSNEDPWPKDPCQEEDEDENDK